jgi:hypothetical protein
MKLATLVAAAAFALVGASSAYAGNSATISQFNTNGNNNAKIKQKGSDNYVNAGQENVNGNNNLKVRQRTGKFGNNAVEGGQGNVNGNNNINIKQRQRH